MRRLRLPLTAALTPGPQPRIPPLLGNLGLDRQTLLAHDAVFRLVAIAEDFSLLRLIEVTEDILPSGRLASNLKSFMSLLPG
jgi:hypothetical protein